jgi:uncharacterized metal-binding protein YceD (DUF177 family)
MTTDNAESLSHPIQIDRLDDEPRVVELTASAEDRELLRQRYDVEDVAFLRGKLTAVRSGDLIRVTGTIDAELGRICGVSLEPMRERIDERFEVEYRIGSQGDLEGEVEADLDAPEPLTASKLDLGEVLVEQLVLAMSPHPRIEDASPPKDPGAGKETSPFDVLKTLKN